jgi:REP element-mobilizing transposase RayT
MSRPLRIPVEDGVYHVVARGNAKQLIFLDDGDRSAFLGVVRDALNRFRWHCLTYCLMPNHYHLVVQTTRPDLSRGMRQINGVYAQRFNRRHDRCGHLFQGRFGATLVQTDQYMLELLRYVSFNPVRGGLCRNPEDWRWSGHAEILGTAAPRLVSVPRVLALFGGDGQSAFEGYRAFIAAKTDWGPPSRGVPILGGQRFRRKNLAASRKSAEIPRTPWRDDRPSLSSLLEGKDRDAAIAAAYREHGYLMKEIAEMLDCHYATVSRRIRRFEERKAA